jgi:AcrR family transcriptional regulator
MPKIHHQQYPHQRSQNKAEQILEGALPEFLKNGYARTSMDKIANSAGVSKQTLYSYYKDKDGLFTALIKLITCQKFQLVWSKPLAGDPRQVLKKLANGLLAEIKDEEYLNFIRLIVAESGTRADLSQLFLSNLSKPAVENLTQYFQSHTELNFKDSEATAITFIGSLIYYILNQELLHGKEIMPIDSDRYVDNLIELVLNKG